VSSSSIIWVACESFYMYADFIGSTRL
jgi:hypothetical protein